MGRSQNPQRADDGAAADMFPVALDAHVPRELPSLGVPPRCDPLASLQKGLVRWSEATLWVQNETRRSRTAAPLPVLLN